MNRDSFDVKFFRDGENNSELHFKVFFGGRLLGVFDTPKKADTYISGFIDGFKHREYKE